MVKPFAGVEGLEELLEDRRLNALVVGPGCGVGRETRELVAAALASKAAIVLDADALTSFTDGPNALFVQLREPAVLTPHEGEFERIFPGLLKRLPTRIEAAREAAAACRCTMLLKGPDTVIAAPDGSVRRSFRYGCRPDGTGHGVVLGRCCGGMAARRSGVTLRRRTDFRRFAGNTATRACRTA
jgi:NAD(P)H-hydrate epimerase